MKNNKHIAKEGYTYKRIIDGTIMGNTLILGKFIDGTDDTIDNYEEVVDESPNIKRVPKRISREELKAEHEKRREELKAEHEKRIEAHRNRLKNNK